MDKLKNISTALGLVIIPIVVAFIANEYSKDLKEREVQARFVELAVSILSKEPSSRDKNIREWATQVLNNYSGVPFNDSARKDLVELVRLPATSGSLSVANNQGDIGFSQKQLTTELISKNLIPQICSAENQMKAGSINSSLEACNKFRTVITQLSPEAKEKLDSVILKKAETAYKTKDFDEASVFYESLFKPYFQYCE